MNSGAFEASVFERIQASEVFAQFHAAFSNATGLPLGLVRGENNWCVEDRDHRSPFCELLTRCEAACGDCRETSQRLLREASEVEGPLSCRCFAGLCATAVPVKLGKTTVGYLRTGQIFNRTPDEEDFSRLMSRWREEQAISAEMEKSLHDAYFQTSQIDPQRYESMVTLLRLFADQLSDYAEKVAVLTEKNEPPGIAAARLKIHRELQEPIPLEKLARAANMSVSHFCRTFKEVTSLTVTEYITRVRINWAREELLRPSRQVAEVAYEVGFQSLSQFNRSFSKLVGMTPTAYRKAERKKANLE